MWVQESLTASSASRCRVRRTGSLVIVRGNTFHAAVPNDLDVLDWLVIFVEVIDLTLFGSTWCRAVTGTFTICAPCTAPNRIHHRLPRSILIRSLADGTSQLPVRHRLHRESLPVARLRHRVLIRSHRQRFRFLNNRISTTRLVVR